MTQESRDFAALECICTSPSYDSYRIGCPYHTAEHLARGPRVRTSEPYPVTCYVATIKVLRTTAMIVDGETVVGETAEFIHCPHNHETISEARKCADRLARKTEKTVA